jgi:L-arabinose isomerase
MLELKKLEIWFVTGSQHLYGPDTLKLVQEHALTIAASIHAAPQIPVGRWIRSRSRK